jgi:hypothetical protein
MGGCAARAERERGVRAIGVGNGGVGSPQSFCPLLFSEHVKKKEWRGTGRSDAALGLTDRGTRYGKHVFKFSLTIIPPFSWARIRGVAFRTLARPPADSVLRRCPALLLLYRPPLLYTFFVSWRRGCGRTLWVGYSLLIQNRGVFCTNVLKTILPPITIIYSNIFRYICIRTSNSGQRKY